MRNFRLSWIFGVSSLSLLLGGCGGGGDGGSSTASTPAAVVVTPAPAPAPSPTPSPAPQPTPSPTPVALDPASAPPAGSWAARAAALFTSQPDVANCRPGMLADSVRADVLARLNAIRALHRLPAVTYSSADDEQATQAALMMAANGQLTHTPPADWKCYTDTGSTGAGTSNLYGGLISPYLAYYTEDMYLGGWLTETTNLVANNVGHRRWMLDPFLGKISYGRVAQVLADGSRTDAAAMKVVSFSGGVTVPGGLPPYVAYPYGDYPARYFDPAALLSFSVIADATRRGGANAQVDYSRATVRVSNGDTALTVSNISFDNTGYGVPNNIQFAVAGLANGVTYTVTIDGVSVRGQAQSYSYTFRIVA
ncbi:CAP domain-containing protein [Sphingomonas sp. RRHST34]|uniref:CAP domain-containing protein n=1 Tax=Sphingomonas citri TaxID=2862499 RepID=A0ABS7BNA9_9SPHN|nr:CAP domain-containing protein [Sphingomonas citri]MBW6531099.1 CAP domain-containing protein [Sphingomonas citri]